MAPPLVRFETPILHPNVEFATGSICLDVLQDKWSPALQVRTTLLSIQGLLSHPNLEDPKEVEVAILCATDPGLFRQRVQHHIEKDKESVEAQLQLLTGKRWRWAGGTDKKAVSTALREHGVVDEEAIAYYTARMSAESEHEDLMANGNREKVASKSCHCCVS